MIFRSGEHEYRLAYFGTEGASSGQVHECIIRRNGNEYYFSSDEQIIFPNVHDEKILSGAQSGDIYWVKDNKRIIQRFDSSSGDATVFMGGNCNSNCIMCPASEYERREDYTLERSCVKEFIQMLPSDLPHYVVTGGEPTLDPELFLDVMADLAKHIPDAEALLLTNGRSFSYRMFLEKMLQMCPPHLTVAVPIHGSEANIHDSIVQVKGGFDQMMRGIRNLLCAGIAVEVRIVVSKQNAEDIGNIADLIIEQFPDVFVVNFISLEVRGSCFTNRDQVYLSPEESFRVSRSAIDRLVAFGIDVGLYNYPLCSIDEAYWSLNHDSITPSKVRFYNSCDACDVRPYCGGFFVSTLNTVHPPARPIHRKVNANAESF